MCSLVCGQFNVEWIQQQQQSDLGHSPNSFKWAFHPKLESKRLSLQHKFNSVFFSFGKLGECSHPFAGSICLNWVLNFLPLSMPDLSDVGPPAKGPGYNFHMPYGIWYAICHMAYDMATIMQELIKMMPPGWVTCIAALSWIALLVLSVSIELVSSSARVTSVKFQKGVSLTQWERPDT